MPGIDSMHCKLATFPQEPRRPGREISKVIRGGAARRVADSHLVARPPLEWNHEVGSGQIPFDCQVPIERLPEVLCPAHEHEGEGRGRAPALEEPGHRESASQKITNGTDGGPVEESPHRMIEEVASHSPEIDVVSQADGKAVARWSGRDLQK